MRLQLYSVCQFGLLALIYVLITGVCTTKSQHVPGRCMCEQTRPGVRGKLSNLTVLHRSPGCNKVTVIVTLKHNNASVCLDPQKPMAKQLIRCWDRVHSLGRNVKVCLRRKKRGGGGQQQRPHQRSRGDRPPPSN